MPSLNQATQIVRTLVQLDRKSSGKCRLTLSQHPLPNKVFLYQFGLTKGSALERLFSIK